MESSVRPVCLILAQGRIQQEQMLSQQYHCVGLGTMESVSRIILPYRRFRRQPYRRAIAKSSFARTPLGISRQPASAYTRYHAAQWGSIGSADTGATGLTGREVKRANDYGAFVAKDLATRRPCIGGGMLLPRVTAAVHTRWCSLTWHWAT